jgi:chaperone required for assembly of F1-ATPase
MAAIMLEWEAQGKVMDLHTMPLTRLLIGCVECNASEQMRLIREITAYAEGDALRYHATQGSVLQHKQAALWMPWLAWGQAQFHVAWIYTHDVMPMPLNAALSSAVTYWLQQQSTEAVVALYALTSLLGSFLMAAALMMDVCSSEEAMSVAWLEHDHQIEAWGAEYELVEKREGALAEVQAIHQFARFIS